MSSHGTGRHALAMAVGAQTLTILPVFLVGSLSTLIRDDLAMDAFGLGMAVAVFYSLSAIGSAALGRVSDTMGAWTATGAGLVATIVALAGIAALVSSTVTLIAFLALAGMANGWVQPSTNLAVSRNVHSRRQGFAFGLKQSSIPIATMLGGIAVPAVGLTLGWRWAFGCAAVIALVILLVLPKDEARVSRPHGSDASGISRGALLVLAVMSGCGAGSANAMAAFLVASITASGNSEALAGIMLALGSIVSIGARISLGIAADTGRVPLLKAVSVLFLGGAAAYLCLAVGSGWVMIAVGSILAFGMGWGWSGLSILAIVRASPRDAGTATGFTQAGVFAGAVFGPLAFGWIVQQGSYAPAWFTMAGIAVAAAFLAIWSDRLIGRPQTALAGTGPA